MKVVYFYSMAFGKDYPEQRRMAAVSIASVRRQMPRAEVIHLTDPAMRPLYGVDSVIRMGGLDPKNRADFQSRMDGECLFIDTDTIMVNDVTPVFHDTAFDVAVSGKNEDGQYNQGVVFSRCPEFWAAVADKARELKVYDEPGFNSVVGSGRFKVKELSNVYNFSVPQDMQIFHFKGQRKKTMLCLT